MCNVRFRRRERLLEVVLGYPDGPLPAGQRIGARIQTPRHTQKPRDQSLNRTRLVFTLESKRGQQGIDRVRQRAVAEVRVVSRGDARIRVAQELRDRQKIGAGLGEKGCAGVATVSPAGFLRAQNGAAGHDLTLGLAS